MKFDIKSCDY